MPVYTSANALTSLGSGTDLRSFGIISRIQGLVIMPEGTVYDDGNGNLSFGSTIIVMNPASGSYFRVASGTYALPAWGALVVDMVPTNAEAATVTPIILTWSENKRNYDGPDRLVLAQRVAGSNIFCNFTLPANFSNGASQNATQNANGALWIAKNTAYGSAPAITVPIGDSDTGLNWVGDGHLQIFANNRWAIDINGSNPTTATQINNGLAWSNGNTTTSGGSNGYIKFPNGYMLQWGTYNCPTTGVYAIYYPVAFPSACAIVVAGAASSAATAVGAYNFTASYFDGEVQYANTTVTFFAMGY